MDLNEHRKRDALTRIQNAINQLNSSGVPVTQRAIKDIANCSFSTIAKVLRSSVLCNKPDEHIPNPIIEQVNSDNEQSDATHLETLQDKDAYQRTNWMIDAFK